MIHAFNLLSEKEVLRGKVNLNPIEVFEKGIIVGVKKRDKTRVTYGIRGLFEEYLIKELKSIIK